LEFLKPGDIVLNSAPVYGGTDHFIKHVLPAFNITNIEFSAVDSKEDIIKKIKEHNAEGKLGLIYVETPANPTNALIDLTMCREIADEFSSPDKKVYVAVDNTYLGPLWQHPLHFGADLVLYSATKYIGGHSDLIAGACLGSSELIGRIKTLRTFLGNMASPWTGWLLMRSLETLKARMEIQAVNAAKVAKFLCDHPKVEKIYYLGSLNKESHQFRIFKRQCLSAGAMLSFDICGGEKEAFMFLNNLKLIKLAVSLGGTESLAEHPATMTHVDVSETERKSMSITDKLIRLSVGVEYHDDIIWDIDQALEKVCK
jgi:methionine-gamma-lyase